MNEYLVIRPDRASPDMASWVTVDQTGALLGRITSGALVDAAAAAAGRTVIVLLPALDVLRTRIEVPVRGGSKLLQALPFALEDQLAEDVEQLHFAAGRRDPDDHVPVAVVRRKLIEDWIGNLRTAGITPQHMYADSDALGTVPNTAIMLVETVSTVLAEADGSVTAMDNDSIDGFLDLWLGRRSAAGHDKPPMHLVVYGVPGVLDARAQTWDRLRPQLESIELRSLADGVLTRLAAQIVTVPGIDLLQGEFARRSSLIELTPAWRIAAALVLGLAVLMLTVQFAELRSLRREIAEVDNDIDQAFHYVFPDAGPVADARSEVSLRLQQLGARAPGAGHAFLDTLRVIAQAVAGSSGARIEAISYRNGTLELRLRAPSVESLDRIQRQVARGGGLKAQIQSANAEGNEVIGRMQIAPAGS